MAKKKKMTSRKKMSLVFVTLIIAILLFSILGVTVLYLGGGGQPQQPTQDIDISVGTNEKTIVIPSDNADGDSVVKTAEDVVEEVNADTDTNEAKIPEDTAEMPENTAKIPEDLPEIIEE